MAHSSRHFLRVAGHQRSVPETLPALARVTLNEQVKEGTMERLDRICWPYASTCHGSGRTTSSPSCAPTWKRSSKKKKPPRPPAQPREMQEWLKALGSPLRMAAHYQPQQYLIGPSLYPIFRNVLRIALSWSAVIYCIASAAAAGQIAACDRRFASAFAGSSCSFTVAAWVTFAFAAIEIAVTTIFKVAGLLRNHRGLVSGRTAALQSRGCRRKETKSFAAAVAEVIFGFFWLVWLASVPAHPFLMFGPGVYYLRSLPYALAPIG